MKRDRNNQFIKRMTTGILLFLLSLSVTSVLSQKGNTVLASEVTEVERTIKVDEKKAYISVEYSGADANVYIEESGEIAVPATPSNYLTWIFAGWYEEDTCDTPVKKSVGNLATCYAKFVPEKVLSVKCQTQEVEDGKSNLRFVTSIDTTNYYRAGFEVSREYSVTNEDGTTSTEVKTYKKETNNSFKRIVASLDSKVKFEYSPKVIDTKSESFVTYTIKNIPSEYYNTEFLVKPYWITLDGAKVYGVSRYVTVNDDENAVVNIPIKVEAKADGTYSSADFAVQKASKDSDGTESFTDVTGATVRYRANEKYASIILSNEESLKSATKYQISGSRTATYVHRNLETEYTGSGTEDTSWYTVYDEESTTEYVIATAADLYGLANLSTNTTGNKKLFAGKTIYVVSDIEANSGTASATSWFGETSYEWTPIGNNKVKFSGVFDGQMHTISGICVRTATSSYSGLFGYTADESLVSNFSLENSYFHNGTTSTNIGYGSIIGCCEGDVNTVYSNANLHYAADLRQIAGIVGRVDGNSTGTQDIKITNCWFDGTITCGDATKSLGIGGIVGASNKNTTLNITNCLNTGIISQNGTLSEDVDFSIGGIFGADWAAGCNITISNCFNGGSITAEGPSSVGTIVGKISQATATYSIDKTFCVSGTEISETMIPNVGFVKDGAIITKNNITTKDSSEVNGYVSYLNVSELGFYGNSKTDEENENKYWVAREKATDIKDGVPALKSFAEYIDVSWYYDTDGYDAGNNTFTIYTEEELFGFSEISQAYNFQNDTIQLGDDIEVNMGGNAEKWAAGTETPKRQWKPIGSNTAAYRFAGTFNGEDPKTGEIHTISGIYISCTDMQYIGFFSTIGASGEVKNFKLTNSYMYAKNSATTSDKLAWGSIAGGAYGDINTVYTDMYLKYENGRQIGGIVGRIAGTELQEIKNCWSDGTMQLIGNSKLQQAGGIAGATNTNAIVSFDNCLNTREIIVSGSLNGNGRIAGIFGADNGASTVTLTNCLQAGTITDTSTCSGDKYIGSIIGRMQSGNSAYTILNVYCKKSELSVVGSRNVAARDEVIVPVNADYLNGENGFLYTTLDFKNIWAVRKDNVPGLQAFIDGEDVNLDKARYDVRWYYDTKSTSPYTIDNEDELYGLAHLVNDGIETFVDEEGNKKIVQLGADIEINAVEEGTVAKWDSGEEKPINMWTPIGTSTESMFAGIFNGKNPETNELHKISGLYINTSDNNYIGLFGITDTGSELKNFQITNTYLKTRGTSNYGTGSVAGEIRGSIDTIYSKATLNTNLSQVGGLVGRLVDMNNNDQEDNVTINNCWFDGTVKSTRGGEVYGGGIAGIVSKGQVEITNSLHTGTIIWSYKEAKNLSIGGIFGADYADDTTVTIANCLNAGETDVSFGNRVGAVVGKINKSTSVYTVQNTYATNDTYIVAGEVTVPVSVGYQNASNTQSRVDDITILSTADLEGIEGYRWAIDLDFTDKWVAREGDVPALQSFVGSGLQTTGIIQYDTDWFYKGQENGIYEITNEEEFYGFTKLVSKGNTFNNITVTLKDDIDMNPGWTKGEGVPKNVWEPIGKETKGYQFQGSFDGQEKTIKGIYVDITTKDAGLFGFINNTNSVLQDFALTNSYIKGTTTRVASIVGCHNGNIYNVYSDATVSGNGQTGGIVGYYTSNTEAEVSSCWYKGDITVSGQYGGGIVGRIGMGTKTIENCLFSGELNSTYSTTNANGVAIGGLLGGIVPGNQDASKNPTGLVMNNNLSAGSLSAKSGQNGIGTIIGTINSYTKDNSTNTPTVTANSIFGITEDASIGANLIEVIVSVTILDKDDILGREAYNQTGFDFENDWTAVAYSVPAPKNLERIARDIEWLSLDTSWYRESPETLTFEIDKVAKLYGLSYLVNRGVDAFAEQTISITDNINVNETSEAILSSWKIDGEDEVVPANEWIPIGTSQNSFAGVFEGNSKTISGVYLDITTTESYKGLFGVTASGSSIQNLRLTDSYFNCTGAKAYMGSVVGDLCGNITNVYSNAIMNSSGTQTGGLVGMVNNTATDNTNAIDIVNCWYDGQVTSSKTEVAGLVARVVNGTVKVDNCLNTGKIKSSCNNINNAVGGICATVTGTSTVVNITDSIAAGKITNTSHGKNVKSVVGYIQGSTVNFENVFATKEAYGRSVPSKGTLKVDDTTYSGSYTGTILRTHKADRLIGYCTEEVADGVIAPKLNFESEWKIRTSDVPVPSCFADLDFVGFVAVADGSTLKKTLDAELGLDYLNETLGLSNDAVLTVGAAINMGEGNYVLDLKKEKISVEENQYNQYINKLRNDLKINEVVIENDKVNSACVDGVHSVSLMKHNPDCVLTLTYVEETKALTISINTDPDSLSDNLVYNEGVEDENYLASGDVTFSMLQLNESTEAYTVEGGYYYGNSFVFQLANGHFIINDGGEKEEFIKLAQYLKAKAREAGLNKVYVDAWIVSHQHGDHIDVIKAIVDAVNKPDEDNNKAVLDAKKDICVDAFYVCEPNSKTLALDSDLNDDVDKLYYGMTLFTKDNGEQSDIYRMHTGQRYFFHGLTMDVIQAQEQIPYNSYANRSAGIKTPDFNTTSTVTLFTTTNNQKIFIGADANYVNMQYIMDSYGENPTTLSNIDVFVAMHHGKNTSMRLDNQYDREGQLGIFGKQEPDPDNSFTEYLIKNSKNTEQQFDVVLFPCSVIYDVNAEGKNVDALHDVSYAFPQAGEANVYLLGFAKNKQYYHYGNGTKEVTLSSTGISIQ